MAAQLATLPYGVNQHTREEFEISNSSTPTVEQAAKLINVSPASVVNARKVMQHGTPDEIEAVKAGGLDTGPRQAQAFPWRSKRLR